MTAGTYVPILGAWSGQSRPTQKEDKMLTLLVGVAAAAGWLALTTLLSEPGSL